MVNQVVCNRTAGFLFVSNKAICFEFYAFNICGVAFAMVLL